MVSKPQASQDILNTIEEQFTLSGETLCAITKQFVDDFNLGLSRYNEPMAMMYVRLVRFGSYIELITISPTFVTGALPDGSETGYVRSLFSIPLLPTFCPLSTFLALDLGGTNL